MTSRQIILYLGDVTPGEEKSFTYTLKPKYPVKAKTPVSVAYEYYTPTNRGTANPVEITVNRSVHATIPCKVLAKSEPRKYDLSKIETIHAGATDAAKWVPRFDG